MQITQKTKCKKKQGTVSLGLLWWYHFESLACGDLMHDDHGFVSVECPVFSDGDEVHKACGCQGLQ